MGLLASDEVAADKNVIYEKRLENGGHYKVVFNPNVRSLIGYEYDADGAIVGEPEVYSARVKSEYTPSQAMELENGNIVLCADHQRYVDAVGWFTDRIYYEFGDGTLVGQETVEPMGWMSTVDHLVLDNGTQVELTDTLGVDTDSSQLSFNIFNSGDGVIDHQTSVTSAYSIGSPHSAALDDGRFVVSWIQLGNAGDNGDGLYFQIFNSDGSSYGEKNHVSPELYSYASPTNVEALASGNFVLTSTTGVSDVSERVFAPDGTLLNSIALPGAGNKTLTSTSTIALADGGWLTAWVRSNTTDSQHGTVAYQRFDANGTTLGQQVVVDSIGSNYGYVKDVKVTALASGGWVVTWYHQSLDGYGYFQQAYDASGSPEGRASRIAEQASENAVVDVKALDDGGWAVSFGDGMTKTFHITDDNTLPKALGYEIGLEREDQRDRAFFGYYDSEYDQATNVIITGLSDPAGSNTRMARRLRSEIRSPGKTSMNSVGRPIIISMANMCLHINTGCKSREEASAPTRLPPSMISSLYPMLPSARTSTSHSMRIRHITSSPRISPSATSTATGCWAFASRPFPRMAASGSTVTYWSRLILLGPTGSTNSNGGQTAIFMATTRPCSSSRWSIPAMIG